MSTVLFDFHIEHHSGSVRCFPVINRAYRQGKLILCFSGLRRRLFKHLMGTQRADMSLSVESGLHEEHSRPTSTFISTLDQIPPLSDSTPLNAKRDEEKKADPDSTEEKLDDVDDWENDPDNARNWSIGRKWVAVAIVCSLTSPGDSEYLFESLRCHSTHSFRHCVVL